jgi:hypothetical protein
MGLFVLNDQGQKFWAKGATDCALSAHQIGYSNFKFKTADNSKNNSFRAKIT